MLHRDDRGEVIGAWERTAERGESCEMEYRMIHRDGSLVWIHDQASSVARDGRFYAEGVFYDVTARRSAEQALQQTEERLRRLVEQLPQIVYVEDAVTGESLYVSPQIEGGYGYTPEEVKADPEPCEERQHR